MLFVIWYHLDHMYHLKNVKNAHGEVSLLGKLQAENLTFRLRKSVCQLFKKIPTSFLHKAS